MTVEIRESHNQLRYLLSLPPIPPPRPVLLFLHGFDEASPTDIEIALTRHGPLFPDAPALVRSEFIIIAPQLPRAGDLWPAQAATVHALLQEVQEQHGGDVARTYLTGFSFGGNGVFDLALALPALWAALWPVDPTRMPRVDPGLPVWLSSGQISRAMEAAWIRTLKLRTWSGDLSAERVLTDDLLDHVGTAAAAYANVRIYEWLLAR